MTATTLKTCSKCGEEKSLDAFHRNRARADGRQDWCRECTLDRQRQADRGDYLRARGEVALAYLRELRSAPCIDCGGDFPPEEMHFHHRDPTTKVRPVTRMLSYSRAAIDREISKCDYPLCGSCHSERHKTLQVPEGDPQATAEAVGSQENEAHLVGVP